MQLFIKPVLYINKRGAVGARDLLVALQGCLPGTKTKKKDSAKSQTHNAKQDTTIKTVFC